MPTTISRAVLATALGFITVTAPALATPTPQHAAHQTGAHRDDALGDKLAARVAATDARLAAARKAGRVTPAHAAQMSKKLAWVRADSAKYVKQQGFLSAAESASYNRALDEIAAKLG